MTLRPAAVEDAPAIAALIASVAASFLADPTRPEDAAAFFETVSATAMESRLRDPAYRYHVAEVKGRLVGVVGVCHGSHLYHLFVEGRHQRRGIALALWAQARSEAGGSGGRFTVNSTLSARPFYHRLGFRESGPVTVKDGVAFVPMELGAGGP